MSPRQHGGRGGGVETWKTSVAAKICRCTRGRGNGEKGTGAQWRTAGRLEVVSGVVRTTGERTLDKRNRGREGKHKTARLCAKPSASIAFLLL